MCIDLDILFFATLRCIFNYKEEFEDTKVAIRIRISEKNRQRNGQKYKRTKNDPQNIHIKLKIE